MGYWTGWITGSRCGGGGFGCEIKVWCWGWGWGKKKKNLGGYWTFLLITGCSAGIKIGCGGGGVGGMILIYGVGS